MSARKDKSRPEMGALIVLVGVLAAGYYAFFGGGRAIPRPVEAAPAEPLPPAQAAPAPPADAGVGPQGWVRPVDAPIWGGFHNSQNPNHQGVDLGAPKGTPVRAASGGTVERVRCNATLNGQAYSCDVDGNAQVLGCGWYVDIRHDGDVVTRYCHLLQQPTVSVGQAVAAGEQIGLSGDSGNSGEPHLHFEVHVGGTPVDPLPFMANKGAPLGA